MQFPITIGLRRSRFLDRALLALMLLAGGAILVFPRSTSLQVAVLLAIGVLSLYSWRCLRPTLSVIRLERDGNVMAVAAGASEFSEATLLHGATVHPWLTTFRLEMADGGRHSVVIAGDCMTREDFRRLRVFLRWRAQFSAADGSRGEPCS